jgi:diketogulonate reductase-like aldo/keto reductase
MEKALKDGKAKRIGVSNYPHQLLKEMGDYANVMPAVNQLELHPKFANHELIKVAKEMGVVLTAYGSCHAAQIDKSPLMAEIAEKYNCTLHQVYLAWTI